MKLQVKGRNLAVTDALYDHAERRIGNIAKVLPDDESTRIELELAVERNPKIEDSQIAEITVRSTGPVLRVRQSSDDMYAAIDNATHRLERQARKHRDRRRDRRRGERARTETAEVREAAAAEQARDERGPSGLDEEREPRLVKEKRFVLQPMDPQDAAHHMDLVEHDFFVFRNERTGEVNVVYRRRDGDFGLIVPQE